MFHSLGCCGSRQKKYSSGSVKLEENHLVEKVKASFYIPSFCLNMFPKIINYLVLHNYSRKFHPQKVIWGNSSMFNCSLLHHLRPIATKSEKN